MVCLMSSIYLLSYCFFCEGNVNFRAFIKQFKPKYAAANRIDKPKVAGEVVAKWRHKNPPGRFLVQIRTTNRNVWNDVGDRKVRCRPIPKCFSDKFFRT